MGWIDQLTSILQIVLIVACVGAVGVFIYIKFIRKGKSRTTDELDRKIVGKVGQCEEFVPVESIKDGIVKLEGEMRYIASINCKGFDFFTASEEEQLQAQMAYLSFLNTLQSPVTMRIDSTSIDLSAQIKRYEAVYKKKEDEIQHCYNTFLEQRNTYKSLSNAADRNAYGQSLIALNKRIDVLSKDLLHIRSLINYETQLSGRNANPLQEERYIIDWTFEPTEFPDTITDEEIYERAKAELSSRVAQMRHTLRSAHVKCTRDDDEALNALSYRHFHPFGGDIFRVAGKDEPTVISGRRGFEEAKRKYEKFLTEKEWMDIQHDTYETEPVADEYDDDDDFLISSGSVPVTDVNELSERGVNI